MLEREQAAIAATLLHGPAHLPPDLFSGNDAAVLRGLRVHANSISHARLVALEETFPRTRAYLGEEEFNRLSRRFVEEGGAQRRSLNDIGAGFADWLADLTGLDEAGLLGLAVRRHPAVRIVALASDAARLVDPAFAADTRVLLVTRPDADVRLFAIEPAAAAALGMADAIAPIGNLIAHLAEQHPDGGTAIAALIEAGAFERI